MIVPVLSRTTTMLSFPDNRIRPPAGTWTTFPTSGTPVPTPLAIDVLSNVWGHVLPLVLALTPSSGAQFPQLNVPV